MFYTHSMKIRARRHKFLLVILLLALLIGGAVAFVPWRQALEGQIKSILSAQGFENVGLTVAGLGWRGLILKDVTFGGDTPLTLRDVSVDYTLAELRHRQVGGLTFNGLSLQARQQNGQWVVDGFEGLMAKPGTKSAFKIPDTTGSLAFIPFHRAAVKDSNLQVFAEVWSLALPLDLTWQNEGAPELSYQGSGITFDAGGLHADVNGVTASLKLLPDEKLWKGDWSVQSLTLNGAPAEIPALKGQGTIEASATVITVQGGFKSADGRYDVSLRYRHDLSDNLKSTLTILSATLPWKGGQLAVKGIDVPVNGTQPIRVNLQVKNVSIDDLMKTLTGKRVSATGVVSGEVPVVVQRDGGFTIQKGTLNALGPGTISMPPDAIPGDNQQIDLVRDILKDLRYSQFSVQTENDANNNFAVLLALEGHNPAVYDGRPVKLNVRLTGDVIDFIQQNLMLLNNPEKLLKAGKNEKN